ncbi:MAG: hypothetical protein COA41_04665 [Sphingopyxis sp.]|nr:MAG: hypothetical protein COA41_04665 [Sphingopyxis sp.]
MNSSDPHIERAAMELLEEAIDVPRGEREAFIRSSPDSPAEVIARALSLLNAERVSSADLATGGARLAEEDDDEESTPDRIGAYRILRLLGRGGMGSVYLGERDTDNFEHVVAIKLIKQKLLSDTLIARFERERQILAQLNHPHIARLYDGGATQSGSPYIVMEYVDGVPLQQWVADETPDLERRLDLFQQICDAVSFAHQNLVIHRDLTPSNILVSAGDQAKLIDFGIARPQAEDDDQSSGSTFSALSLTPGFSAPERAMGQAANTLSDVYSLGKILQFLTKDQDAPELQAIAATATSERPEDRFGGAAMLSEELRRYRDGYPVKVYSDQKRYRFRKYLWRQRYAVGSLATIIMLLVAGLAATGWAYNRAEIARAETEQRFDEVRELANFMLFDLYDELEPVTGNTRALTRIADKSRHYLDLLGRESRADPELELEIAQGYKRLSQVLGNPEAANLGRREEAGKALRIAVRRLEALHRENPDNDAVKRSLAEAQYALSIFIFIAEDQNEEAIAPAERSAKLYQSLSEGGSGTLDDDLGRIRSALQAAKPLVWNDHGADAVARMSKLAGQIGTLAKQHPANRIVLYDQARTLSALSSAMSWHYEIDSPDYLRAIPPSDQAIRQFEALHKRYPDWRAIDRSLIAAYFTRALIHYDLEKLKEAASDLFSAEAIAIPLTEKDPDDRGMARRLQTIYSQLAPVLAELGRFQEAKTMAQRLVSDREASSATEPDNAGYFRDKTSALMILADVVTNSGDKAEGCRLYKQARDDWRVIERRWGIDELLRKNDIEPIEDALRSC